MAEKPTSRNSASEKELDKVEKQFQAFDENVKSMTLDHLNQVPKQESEASHKMTQNEIADAKDIYIQPFKSINSREKFNENYRDDYNFAMEWVYITAQNNMIINEFLQFWTKPFAGMPFEEWKVPVNKPIWVRRHVAERIKGCVHHELHMDESKRVDSNEYGDMVGQMVAKKTIQRLDAHPATKRKSIFMGAGSF